MHTKRAPFFFVVTVALYCLSLLPLRADSVDRESAAARAAQIAAANGVPHEEAKSLGAKLRQVLAASADEDTLIGEVVKLCEDEPHRAAAIAAASTAFAERKRFILRVAEASAKAVRSQAPAIAAAVAAASPLEAPLIASRVARSVPNAAVRITRRVAYAVPQCVEGTTMPHRVSRLESAVISAVPMITVTCVYGAAYRGARDAAREGRHVLD